MRRFAAERQTPRSFPRRQHGQVTEQSAAKVMRQEISSARSDLRRAAPDPSSPIVTASSSSVAGEKSPANTRGLTWVWLFAPSAATGNLAAQRFGKKRSLPSIGVR